MLSAINDPTIRILKVGSCPSMSGRSTLTYHIGCKENSAIQLRIHNNTGSGYFSREWISFAAIEQLLDGNKAITSNSFRSIFQGKSVNTAGFLMAVLKSLGLIQATKDSLRCYERSKSDSFTAEIKALIESAVDLTEDDLSKLSIPAKKGSTKSKANKASSSPTDN